jgi:dTDP-4-dehydrorhamnose reductase
MDKLLVVGVEQVAGANLALALSQSFSVLGLSHQQSVTIAGCHTAACNLDDYEHLAWQIHQYWPQWTILCGALSRSSWDGVSDRIASDAALAAAVASAAGEIESRVTIISTDAVFSAPKIFHDESSPITNSPLAEAALALEKSLEGTRALVVRTNAYGWSCCDGQVSFAERLCESWQQQPGNALLGDDEISKFQPSPHVCATPILATDLAPLLQKSYELGLHGVLHIAGAERASQRRFAMELAAALGLRMNSQAASLTRIDAACHPVETSLISLRAQNALELPLPMLREGLTRFAAQHDDGFRRNLRGEGALAHAA